MRSTYNAAMLTNIQLSGLQCKKLHNTGHAETTLIQAACMQVWRWSQQYQAQLTGQALPEMTELIDWLKNHIPADDSDASVGRISHGDYRSVFCLYYLQLLYVLSQFMMQRRC